MDVMCGPPLCAPIGPGEPWGSPLLILLDTGRALIVFASVYIVMMCMRYAMFTDDPTQRSRFIGAALFAVVIAGTEISHIGDHAHWRYVLALVATGLMAWGTRPAVNAAFTSK